MNWLKKNNFLNILMMFKECWGRFGSLGRFSFLFYIFNFQNEITLPHYFSTLLHLDNKHACVMQGVG